MVGTNAKLMKSKTEKLQDAKVLIEFRIHRSREQSFIAILRGAPTVVDDFSVPDLRFKKFPDLTTV